MVCGKVLGKCALCSHPAWDQGAGPVPALIRETCEAAWLRGCRHALQKRVSGGDTAASPGTERGGQRAAGTGPAWPVPVSLAPEGSSHFLQHPPGFMRGFNFVWISDLWTVEAPMTCWCLGLRGRAGSTVLGTSPHPASADGEGRAGHPLSVTPFFVQLDVPLFNSKKKSCQR